jgi:hypothetical protein
VNTVPFLPCHIREKTAVATPLPAGSEKIPQGDVLGTLRNVPAAHVPVPCIPNSAVDVISCRCVSKGGLRFATTNPTDGWRGTASASLPRKATPVALTALPDTGVPPCEPLTCAGGAR